MKIDEAKPLIIQEWSNWCAEHVGDSHATNMQLFYTWLQKNRPELLSFRAAGDKWQTVKSWVNNR